MSNSLEFKISAEDQASKVVETVQHKIENFGIQVGKSLYHMVGPLALFALAFSKISDYFEEQKQRRETIQNELTAMAEKEAQENAQRYKIAKKNIDDETASIEARAAARKKELEDEKNRPEKLQLAAAKFLKYDPTGKKILEEETILLQKRNDELNKTLLYTSGSEDVSLSPTITNEEYLIKILSERKDVQDKVRESNAKLNNEADIAEQKRIAGLHELENALKKSNAEFEKQEKLRKKELELTERINKAQIALIEAKSRNREIMTVSSLRESGGGIAGETAAIKAQQNQSLQTPEQLQAVQNAQTWLDSAKMMKETVMDFDKAVSKISEKTSVPNVFNTPGIYTGSMDGN